MVNTNVSAVSAAGGPPQTTTAGGGVAAAANVGSSAAGFLAILSQEQPIGSSTLSDGVDRYPGQDLVDAAIVAQAAAQALAGGGANPGVAGPAGYGRGAALDYVAQLQNVIANGSYLPNATGPGLTVLPGTPRNAAPQSTIDDYTKLVGELTSQWNFTADELASAGQRLTTNLEAGISLDPGTSAAVIMERVQRGWSVAQFTPGATAPVHALSVTGAAGSPATAATDGTTRALEATTAKRSRVAAKPKAPTGAQLAAIRARAVASGHRPTHEQVLATYYRYA